MIFNSFIFKKLNNFSKKQNVRIRVNKKNSNSYNLF